MPLYGLDEHLYRERGKIKPIGSIVSPDTLQEMLPHYIPGMDQPGDWSERHLYLYNDHTYENGNIQGHLEKSIQFMESLDKLNSQQVCILKLFMNLPVKKLENVKRN